MQTKSKILTCFATVGILSTGLFACPSYHDGNHIKQFKGHKVHHMSKHKMDHRKKNPIVELVMRLDLTKDQKHKMKDILTEFKSSIKHPTHAFTASSFDKKMFIKIINEKETSKIQKEAQLIQSVYNILDDKQKKHLKTMLDMDEIKHTKLRECHGLMLNVVWAYGQRGESQRERREPPAQAIEICQGLSDGSSCQMRSPHGDTVQGTCSTTPDGKYFACKPERRGRGRSSRRE